MQCIKFGIRVYAIWALLLVLTILPSFLHVLHPLWRLVASLAPLIIALDIDAGNHSVFYAVKFVISLIFTLLSLPLWYQTSGFENETPFFRAIIPVLVLLFFASCVTTVVANRRRQRVWVGRTTHIHAGNDLFPVDSGAHNAPYADYPSRTINTPLSPDELCGAWESDGAGGRRTLSREEVQQRVLRICFVTQFVMQRIFKSPQNHVYVFSLVAWYRMRVLLLLAAVAGVMDVVDGLFRGTYASSNVMSKAILWLTLPSITVPAILRIYFGNRASLKLLYYGFLPVSSDRELWLRLGVSPRDLYTALTNGARAGRVLKENVGVINGAGLSHVKVTNLPEARRVSKESLINVGDFRVRVFDGARFRIHDGSLRDLSTIAMREKLSRRRESMQQERDDTVTTASKSSLDMREKQEEPAATGWESVWETHGGVLGSDVECKDNGGDEGVKEEGDRQWWHKLKKWWKARDGMTQDVRKQLRVIIALAFSNSEIEEEEYDRLTESVTVDGGRPSDSERVLQIVAGAFWQERIDWVQYRRVSQPLERRLGRRFVFGNTRAICKSKGIEEIGDHVHDESENV